MSLFLVFRRSVMFDDEDLGFVVIELGVLY